MLKWLLDNKASVVRDFEINFSNIIRDHTERDQLVHRIVGGSFNYWIVLMSGERIEWRGKEPHEQTGS